MNTLLSLAKKLRHVFNQFSDEPGEPTGLIKRTRKLTGSNFVKILVFTWLEDADATVENLSRAGMNHGIEMSSPALDKRFDETSAKFLQTVLEETVAQVVQAPAMVPIKLLNRFNGVYLINCIQINLPSELAKLWPGSGKEGDANYTALKLEAIFELHSARLTGLDFLPGCRHDNWDLWQINHLALTVCGYQI